MKSKQDRWNINQEKVWLNTQQVTVKEHGDWADVELYEVYQNFKHLMLAFYSFSFARKL